MSTDDTYVTGEELGSFSSTPPRPLPTAKRMRLSVTRIDTRKGRRRTYVLAPLAKRFRFDDANSSSSSSSYPLPLYGSSPHRMSPDLLAPRVLSSSQSLTCSTTLQTWCAHLPVESSPL